MLKNKFCRVPFENLEISHERSDGSIPCFTCCSNWLPESAGDLKEKEILDIWNSEKMQEIRASILDGSFKFCSKEFCPEIQSDTLPLKSQIVEPHLKKIIENQEVVLKEGPRNLNMAMDQTCNLACPSCREGMIVSDKEKQKEISDLYKVAIDPIIGELDSIFCCSSGDPFASKVYRNFLKDFDIQKNPKIKFQINTNGVLFDQKAWEDIKPIQKNISQILISIDAAREETYKIVRKGGDFQRLLENIKFLVSKKKEGYLPHIRLDFVIQQKNYREIPAFIRLGKELGVDEVYFQKINDWGTFPVGEFKNHAIYEPNHPEYSIFLETLNGPELLDPILKPGNIGEFLSEQAVRKLNRNIIYKRLVDIIKSQNETIDSYWANFHHIAFNDESIVHYRTFDLAQELNLIEYFEDLDKNLERGQGISVIEHWDSCLSRYLNRGNLNINYDPNEDIWTSKKQESNNRSLLYILMGTSNNSLRMRFPSLVIEHQKFILPSYFILKQRLKLSNSLTKALSFGIDILLLAIKRKVSLHSHLIIRKV